MKRIYALFILLLLWSLPTKAQRPLTIVGGVVTANVADTNDFQVVLTANVTGVTLTSTTGSANTAVTPATGYQITMRFTQDATGSRTVAFGGNITTTCSINATANAVTICRWQYTASGNTWADAGGSGIASPSSLTTFFTKFYGLAPQDCGNATCTVAGAKGDTHVYFDCGMTTNNHVTCGSAHFQASDATNGKWIESCASACTNGPSGINAGTITVFNSATDVTVSVTAGTTYTNQRLAFGTDDDAAMQNWATFMTQSPTLGAPPSTHGGYIPAGGYAIKQPLQIKYPGCATQGSCTQGEGGPNSGNTGTLRPSLWIAGQGTASSFIYVRTAASFTWPTQTANVAAFYVKDFDFSSLTNFAVIADVSAHNTTTVTSPGKVALIMQDNSTHAMWAGLWMQGGHNTTNNMCGFLNSANDFESSYSYMASELNDINGCIGRAGSGVTPVTMEKILFTGNFWEIPLQGQNIQFGDGSTNLHLKQITFVHNHSLSASVASINFLNSVDTLLGETVQFYGWRQQNSLGTSGLGMVVSTTIGLNIDFHGSYFEDTQGAAGNFLIDNTSANATINLYGGALQCASCTNAFNNAGNIFVYGTKLTGPTVANIQTGAGNTYAFIPVPGANGGWSGKGVIRSTLFTGDQGTAQTSGNIALTSGWSTSTVGTVSGFTNFSRWIVTVAGTPAASPVITVTFPVPFPTNAPVCQYEQEGGTFGVVSNPAITTTTSAATLTFSGTPVAAQTYTMALICGN